MIVEVTDPAIVNAYANYPGIRQYLGGDGDLDLSAGVREPNVFLFGEHGGFCFSWMGPGVFSVDVMFTLMGRGKWGIEAGKLAIELMRERGMTHLWGRVHPERREIAVYARCCGMRDTGQRVKFNAGDGEVIWRIFEWRA